MEPDGTNILTYKEAIVRTQQPESVVILGAGAIGLEFAYFLNAMGTEVTLVEGQDRLAPLEDAEISKQLQKSSKKLGIKIKTGTFCKGVSTTGKGTQVRLSPAGSDEEEVLEAEITMLALGVRPNVENLGLEEVGVNWKTASFKPIQAAERLCPAFMRSAMSQEPPAWPTKQGGPRGSPQHSRPRIETGRSEPDSKRHLYCPPGRPEVGKTQEQLEASNTPYTIGQFNFCRKRQEPRNRTHRRVRLKNLDRPDNRGNPRGPHHRPRRHRAA